MDCAVVDVLVQVNKKINQKTKIKYRYLKADLVDINDQIVYLKLLNSISNDQIVYLKLLNSISNE